MTTVNVLSAKTHLSRLIDDVESGREPEIIIARNGKPAVRLVQISNRPRVRLGLAKGLFEVPEPDPAFDEEIAKLFNGDDEE